MAYDIKRLPSEASVDHDHEASLHDIKISGITKSFYNNGEMRQVLRPVDILIPHGKFVSIIGPSGCGKSTLFNIVAGLLRGKRLRWIYAAKRYASPVAYDHRQYYFGT